MKKEQVAVRLPLEVVVAVEAAARISGRSKTAVIVEALSTGLGLLRCPTTPTPSEDFDVGARLKVIEEKLDAALGDANTTSRPRHACVASQLAASVQGYLDVGYTEYQARRLALLDVVNKLDDEQRVVEEGKGYMGVDAAYRLVAERLGVDPRSPSTRVVVHGEVFSRRVFLRNKRQDYFAAFGLEVDLARYDSGAWLRPVT